MIYVTVAHLFFRQIATNANALPTLLQLEERGGVVGLIMAQHQLSDGLRSEETTSFEDSLDVIFAAPPSPGSRTR